MYFVKFLGFSKFYPNPWSKKSILCIFIVAALLLLSFCSLAKPVSTSCLAIGTANQLILVPFRQPEKKG